MKKLISPAGIASAIGIALLIVVAAIGPLVWGEAAATRSIGDRLASAGLDSLFGTDDLGRDIFARVMAATRLSLLLTAGATAIGVTGGLVIGLAASIMPKHLRRAVVWVMDMLLAFPWLLLVLFFTVIWGATATGAMLAIGLAGIPNLTRLVYNLASSVSGKDYVRGGTGGGGGTIRGAVPPCPAQYLQSPARAGFCVRERHPPRLCRSVVPRTRRPSPGVRLGTDAE